MVETLKQSGHEVTLILKVPTPELKEGSKEDEKDDQTDEGVVADGSSGSCDPLDPSTDTLIESDGLSLDDLDIEDGSSIKSPDEFQGDTDLSGLHNMLRTKKEISLDIKRTSSVPLTDREKANSILDKNSKDTLGCNENIIEETDGSSPSPRLLGVTFEQRLHQRTASEGQGKVRVCLSESGKGMTASKSYN